MNLKYNLKDAELKKPKIPKHFIYGKNTDQTKVFGYTGKLVQSYLLS